MDVGSLLIDVHSRGRSSQLDRLGSSSSYKRPRFDVPKSVIDDDLVVHGAVRPYETCVFSLGSSPPKWLAALISSSLKSAVLAARVTVTRAFFDNNVTCHGVADILMSTPGKKLVASLFWWVAICDHLRLRATRLVWRTMRHSEAEKGRQATMDECLPPEAAVPLESLAEVRKASETGLSLPTTAGGRAGLGAWADLLVHLSAAYASVCMRVQAFVGPDISAPRSAIAATTGALRIPSSHTHDRAFLALRAVLAESVAGLFHSIWRGTSSVEPGMLLHHARLRERVCRCVDELLYGDFAPPGMLLMAPSAIGMPTPPGELEAVVASDSVANMTTGSSLLGTNVVAASAPRARMAHAHAQVASAVGSARVGGSAHDAAAIPRAGRLAPLRARRATPTVHISERSESLQLRSSKRAAAASVLAPASQGDGVTPASQGASSPLADSELRQSEAAPESPLPHAGSVAPPSPRAVARGVLGSRHTPATLAMELTLQQHPELRQQPRPGAILMATDMSEPASAGGHDRALTDGASGALLSVSPRPGSPRRTTSPRRSPSPRGRAVGFSFQPQPETPSRPQPDVDHHGGAISPAGRHGALMRTSDPDSELLRGSLDTMMRSMTPTQRVRLLLPSLDSQPEAGSAGAEVSATHFGPVAHTGSRLQLDAGEHRLQRSSGSSPTSLQRSYTTSNLVRGSRPSSAATASGTSKPVIMAPSQMQRQFSEAAATAGTDTTTGSRAADVGSSSVSPPQGGGPGSAAAADVLLLAELQALQGEAERAIKASRTEAVAESALAAQMQALMGRRSSLSVSAAATSTGSARAVNTPLSGYGHSAASSPPLASATVIGGRSRVVVMMQPEPEVRQLEAGAAASSSAASAMPSARDVSARMQAMQAVAGVRRSSSASGAAAGALPQAGRSRRSSNGLGRSGSGSGSPRRLSSPQAVAPRSVQVAADSHGTLCQKALPLAGGNSSHMTSEAGAAGVTGSGMFTSAGDSSLTRAVARIEKTVWVKGALKRSASEIMRAPKEHEKASVHITSRGNVVVLSARGLPTSSRAGLGHTGHRLPAPLNAPVGALTGQVATEASEGFSAPGPAARAAATAAQPVVVAELKAVSTSESTGLRRTQNSGALQHSPSRRATPPARHDDEITSMALKAAGTRAEKMGARNSTLQTALARFARRGSVGSLLDHPPGQSREGAADSASHDSESRSDSDPDSESDSSARGGKMAEASGGGALHDGSGPVQHSSTRIRAGAATLAHRLAAAAARRNSSAATAALPRPHRRGSVQLLASMSTSSRLLSTSAMAASASGAGGTAELGAISTAVTRSQEPLLSLREALLARTPAAVRRQRVVAAAVEKHKRSFNSSEMPARTPAAPATLGFSPLLAIHFGVDRVDASEASAVMTPALPHSTSAALLLSMKHSVSINIADPPAALATVAAAERRGAGALSPFPTFGSTTAGAASESTVLNRSRPLRLGDSASQHLLPATPGPFSRLVTPPNAANRAPLKPLGAGLGRAPRMGDGERASKPAAEGAPMTVGAFLLAACRHELQLRAMTSPLHWQQKQQQSGDSNESTTDNASHGFGHGSSHHEATSAAPSSSSSPLQRHGGAGHAESAAESGMDSRNAAEQGSESRTLSRANSFRTATTVALGLLRARDRSRQRLSGASSPRARSPRSTAVPGRSGSGTPAGTRSATDSGTNTPAPNSPHGPGGSTVGIAPLDFDFPFGDPEDADGAEDPALRASRQLQRTLRAQTAQTAAELEKDASMGLGDARRDGAAAPRHHHGDLNDDAAPLQCGLEPRVLMALAEAGLKLPDMVLLPKATQEVHSQTFMTGLPPTHPEAAQQQLHDDELGLVQVGVDVSPEPSSESAVQLDADTEALWPAAATASSTILRGTPVALPTALLACTLPRVLPPATADVREAEAKYGLPLEQIAAIACVPPLTAAHSRRTLTGLATLAAAEDYVDAAHEALRLQCAASLAEQDARMEAWHAAQADAQAAMLAQAHRTAASLAEVAQQRDAALSNARAVTRHGERISLMRQADWLRADAATATAATVRSPQLAAAAAASIPPAVRAAAAAGAAAIAKKQRAAQAVEAARAEARALVSGRKSPERFVSTSTGNSTGSGGHRLGDADIGDASGGTSARLEGDSENFLKVQEGDATGSQHALRPPAAVEWSASSRIEPDAINAGSGSRVSDESSARGSDSVQLDIAPDGRLARRSSTPEALNMSGRTDPDTSQPAADASHSTAAAFVPLADSSASQLSPSGSYAALAPSPGAKDREARRQRAAAALAAADAAEAVTAEALGLREDDINRLAAEALKALQQQRRQQLRFRGAGAGRSLHLGVGAGTGMPGDAGIMIHSAPATALVNEPDTIRRLRRETGAAMARSLGHVARRGSKVDGHGAVGGEAALGALEDAEYDSEADEERAFAWIRQFEGPGIRQAQREKTIALKEKEARKREEKARRRETASLQATAAGIKTVTATEASIASGSGAAAAGILPAYGTPAAKDSFSGAGLHDASTTADHHDGAMPELLRPAATGRTDVTGVSSCLVGEDSDAAIAEAMRRERLLEEHARRRHYELGSTMGPLSQARASGVPWHRGADDDKGLRTGRELGLSRRDLNVLKHAVERRRLRTAILEQKRESHEAMRAALWTQQSASGPGTTGSTSGPAGASSHAFQIAGPGAAGSTPGALLGPTTTARSIAAVSVAEVHSRAARLLRVQRQTSERLTASVSMPALVSSVSAAGGTAARLSGAFDAFALTASPLARSRASAATTSGFL